MPKPRCWPVDPEFAEPVARAIRIAARPDLLVVDI